MSKNYQEISNQIQRIYSDQRKALPPLTKSELEQAIVDIDQGINLYDFSSEFINDVHTLLNPVEPEQFPSPTNWGLFRVGMKNSVGINRIKKLVDPDLYTEVAVAASSEYLPEVKLTWNALIDALVEVDKPTTAEITEWNQIAVVANILDNSNLLVFDENGKL